jgi:hypothetical protein
MILLSTIGEECYQWQIVDQIPMEVNSFLHSADAQNLMESTQFLERSLMDLMP